MSRCPGRHAKTASRYEGRHIKPSGPGPAALVGTAAKAVPASLMVGAAGSVLVLSGTASAATAAPAGLARGASTDLAAVKTAALHTSVSTGRHASRHPVYTVVSGDTLSSISARFCGTSADYPSLAAASGITDPNVIYAGQAIKLSCHHRAAPAPAPSGDAASAASAAPPRTTQASPPPPASPTRT